MLLDGHTAASVCERLGLPSPNSLYRWKRELVSQGGSTAVGLEARVRQLEGELRRVRKNGSQFTAHVTITLRRDQAGTPIAHDLSHVGRKYTEAELAQWLRDPKAQKPNAHMPRLMLSDDEIRALAGYLATLR